MPALTGAWIIVGEMALGGGFGRSSVDRCETLGLSGRPRKGVAENPPMSGDPG